MGHRLGNFRAWVWLSALSLGGAAVRVLVMPGVTVQNTYTHIRGDGFWLIRNAFLFMGQSVNDATSNALAMYVKLADPHIADVKAAVASQLPTYLEISQRYIGIFESRPLASLMAIGFMSVFGTAGLLITVILELAVTVFLAAVIVARVTHRPVSDHLLQAAVVVLAFLVLPTGLWGSMVLYEIPFYMCALAAGIFFVEVTLRDNHSWVTFLLAGVTAAAATASKSSVALAMLGILFIYLVIRFAGSRGRDRSSGILAVIYLVIVGAWLVLSSVMHWPGIIDSFQDTFTEHFTKPDVANPVQMWVHYLVYALNERGQVFLANPGLPLAAIMGLAFLIWRFGSASIYWIALFCAALSSFVLHPMDSEFNRFTALCWFPLACSIGIVVADLKSVGVSKLNRTGFVSWRP